MRRFFALLLCGLVLLSTGCAYAAVSSQRGEGDYELFFREADLTGVPGGDALRAEIIHLEEEQRQDPQEVARTLLTALLEGPTDETLCSTIPAGTTLLSLELDGSLARVDLSAAYRSLSGISLALADYSIAMTLTQLREIAAVTITVRGQQLAYRDKQTFSDRDVLLSSNEDVVSTVTAALYFPDQSGKLVPEERTLDLYEGDTQADAVVRALAAGPLDESLSDALPEGFRVQSIWVEDDICYVNLPSAALEALPEEHTLEAGLEALKRSLLSLDAVEAVRFLVDGSFQDTYGTVALPTGGRIRDRPDLLSGRFSRSAEKQPHRQRRDKKSREVCGDGGGNGVAGADDPCRAVIDGDGVKGSLRAAQHHCCHPAHKAVRSMGGHKLCGDCQGPAAGNGADQHQRGGLRRNAQPFQDRAQRLERSSIAPEARNMLTAVRSPTSAGTTRSKTVSPSSAPWVRAPYTSARCPRPHTATPASKTGITRELRLMAASFPRPPAVGPSRGRHKPTRWRRPIPPGGCRRESRSRRRHGRRPLWWAAVGWTRC